jgi:hypothetical protein
MDTNTYIKQVLTEHLLTPAYRKLSETEAKLSLDNTKSILKNLILNNKQYLSKAELTYFQRSLQLHHRIPIFYGIPKVHKSPITLRPVVSGTNSLLAIFSNWLDYKLKDLLVHVKSFIKDSYSVLQDLKELHLPKEALLFSADATAMYTNIDTKLGVNAIKAFLLDHINDLPPNFPVNLILQVLTIIMDNNIFSFSDSYWLQLSGTAMGTPVACTYAMMSFGHFENKEILPKFHNNLFYYKRYIDDILGIWIPPTHNKTATWNRFKQTLNSWGSLKWIVEDPSNRTKFLDLDLHIKGSSIQTETYQKSMNLYLYIPPLSAHPSSCLKGLISGELRRYWIQNHPLHFQEILASFLQRLIDRGHTLNSLIPLVLQAANKLDHRFSLLPVYPNNKTENLYIHWLHHPNGLQRSDIRQSYDKILKPFLPFDKMQIAVSRPRNLRDILVKAKLTPSKKTNIETIFVPQNQI